jgi:hypothetical protein
MWRKAELVFDVADRYRMTVREVNRMVHVVCFGPEWAQRIEVDGDETDPAAEMLLDLQLVNDALDARPSIPELLEIWTHCRNVCAALCERQTDLTKRAAMFAALVECEARMAALQERLVERVERDAAGLGAK